MSERLHNQKRIERIRDIRARKGYLLGVGTYETLGDRRKFSKPTSEGNIDGKFTEIDIDVLVDKGTPRTMLRQLPPSVSEFVPTIETNGGGRESLDQAVERQQAMLAECVTGMLIEGSIAKHDSAFLADHHPTTLAEQDEYLEVTGYYFSPSGL